MEHPVDQNLSKMVIILERRPMGAYPFEIFHTSLESTLFTRSER